MRVGMVTSASIRICLVSHQRTSDYADTKSVHKCKIMRIKNGT